MEFKFNMRDGGKFCISTKRTLREAIRKDSDCRNQVLEIGQQLFQLDLHSNSNVVLATLQAVSLKAEDALHNTEVVGDT